MLATALTNILATPLIPPYTIYIAKEYITWPTSK